MAKYVLDGALQNMRMARLAVVLFIAPLLILGLLFAGDIWLEAGAPVVLIFWIFVSIPVGILVVIDWFRRGSPSTGVHRAVYHVLRIPIFLLGLVACVIGVGVLLWVAYNLFWDRRPEFRAGPGSLIFFALIGFGWYLIRLAIEPRNERDDLDPDSHWNRIEQECAADENCRKMRAAAQLLGREFETMAYERLLEPAEVLSGSRVFDGDLLHFSAEAYRIDDNGDLHFCVDISGLATSVAWLPSYRFIKRRDGTVVHGLRA